MKATECVYDMHSAHCTMLDAYMFASGFPQANDFIANKI